MKLVQMTEIPPVSTGFIHAFISSLSMILVSEIGDKTFFIAAVMAMKNTRLIVFLAAMSALALMTIISVLFGYVTTFIPRIYTYYISTALFGIFGFKMIFDGLQMTPEEETEEFEEVQANLRSRSEANENSPLRENEEQAKRLVPNAARRILLSCFSRVFFQASTMTFLAEWGDRSQLATIALAATENVFGVIVGGILGHSICTGLAVIGGRMLAQKISVKTGTVTVVGGLVFLAFAIISLFMNPNN